LDALGGAHWGIWQTRLPQHEPCHMPVLPQLPHCWLTVLHEGVGAGVGRGVGAGVGRGVGAGPSGHGPQVESPQNLHCSRPAPLPAALQHTPPPEEEQPVVSWKHFMAPPQVAAA